MASQVVNYNNTLGESNIAPLVFLPFFLNAIRNNSTLKVEPSNEMDCQNINFDATYFGCGITLGGKLCQNKHNEDSSNWSIDLTLTVTFASIELVKTSVHLDNDNAKFCRDMSIGLMSVNICLEVTDNALILSGEACAFGDCDNFSVNILSWLQSNHSVLLSSNYLTSGGRVYSSLAECVRNCPHDCGKGRPWKCVPDSKPHFRCVCH